MALVWWLHSSTSQNYTILFLWTYECRKQSNEEIQCHLDDGVPHTSLLAFTTSLPFSCEIESTIGIVKAKKSYVDSIGNYVIRKTKHERNHQIMAKLIAIAVRRVDDNFLIPAYTS